MRRDMLVRGCLVAAMFGTGAGTLFVTQYVAAYERLELLEASLAEVQKAIQQGLIMEAQRPAFDKERDKLAAQMETLVRILPLAVDADGYASHTRAMAAAAGLDATFEGEPATSVRSDGVVTAVFRLRACGPDRSAEEFLSQLCRKVPMTVIDGFEQEDGCTRARLATYALARPSPEGAALPCPAPPPRRTVWMWPWHGWIRDHERKMQDACAESARLHAIIGEVRQFTSDKDEIERRVSLVDALAKAGRERAWCGPPE